MLGSDPDKADTGQSSARLLGFEQGSQSLGPDTMLRGLFMAIVQQAVVGDGIDHEGDVISDSKVVLEVPLDQRVQKVGWRGLNNGRHGVNSG